MGTVEKIRRFLTQEKVYLAVIILGLATIPFWHWVYSGGAFRLHPVAHLLVIIALFSALGYPGGKLVKAWKMVNEDGR